MKNGALQYVETVADDVKIGKRTSSPRSVKPKRGEASCSSIVDRSRGQRDRINARVTKQFMSDPKWKKFMDPKNMPFDGKRTFWAASSRSSSSTCNTDDVRIEEKRGWRCRRRAARWSCATTASGSPSSTRAAAPHERAAGAPASANGPPAGRARIVMDGPFARPRNSSRSPSVERRDLDEVMALAGRIPTLPHGGVVEVRALEA